MNDRALRRGKERGIEGREREKSEGKVKERKELCCEETTTTKKREKRHKQGKEARAGQGVGAGVSVVLCWDLIS